MTKAEFEHGVAGGIRIHVLPTRRFKTFAISLYAGTPLAEDTVTSTALTPFVLRRGTVSYPETRAFRERLEQLYGAGFGFDVYKRGDYQIVHFRMDTINDSFVQSPESLLASSFSFLGEAFTQPVLENGAFRKSYVMTERDTVRKKLESIVNDKIRYAAERCIEVMCKNEPYRLHPLGERKDLDGITPEGLYEAYQAWLQQSSLDLYVVGDTSLEEVKALVEQHFKLNRTAEVEYAPSVIRQAAGEAETVIEQLDINQGKLNMGLRGSITYGDDDYVSALMYNGILGGYPHSKLFVNVREKASLAYYASSRYDGHKGIATIQSGIEVQNFDQAVDIIRKQLDDMAAGAITDLELSQTKAMIRNVIKEMQDSAFEIIAYDFNRQLSGRERSPDDMLAQVAEVSVDDVKKAAEAFTLDTIYFLKGQKEE
ncbi:MULTISPECIES: EF-P 5-aminopentanol modification-associated protein YfmF [Paenibacillus]|uniref:Insulinase family protein n=1 Tax=Paenibacillus campinasensis TaxID=66347 RepID=A0A268ES10_9BACL|nr:MULTISPECIES: pitrilysin family protein [Paenibacillus]MUG66692.1 insulinase family protein [Paenibacillus campinasensis]PAD75915.1 peptidase M16 [Paenibacillus campinasensis]PAK54683.1 peptidase M16 [Paenibacillus sp. 7541]